MRRTWRGSGTSCASQASMLPPLLLSKLLVVAAFSVVPTFGTHQLSSVEKRHHELGAQRNTLFDEMRQLLKQQQDEVAACRAALIKTEQAMAQVVGGGGGSGAAGDGGDGGDLASGETAACAASLSSAPESASSSAVLPRPRDTIATIAGAGRASGRTENGAALGTGVVGGETAILEEADARTATPCCRTRTRSGGKLSWTSGQVLECWPSSLHKQARRRRAQSPSKH
ncbi:unnamed protein product [Hapterophycus canaliculatus]